MDPYGGFLTSKYGCMCLIGEQSEKSIRVFLSGIIYQYLLSGDGIALPVHSINDRHDAYIF